MADQKKKKSRVLPSGRVQGTAAFAQKQGQATSEPRIGQTTVGTADISRQLGMVRDQKGLATALLSKKAPARAPTLEAQKARTRRQAGANEGGPGSGLPQLKRTIQQAQERVKARRKKRKING